MKKGSKNGFQINVTEVIELSEMLIYGYDMFFENSS
jgi:hypothetical protein